MVKIIIVIISCLLATFVTYWLNGHVANEIARYVCQFILFLIIVVIAIKTPFE